MGASAGIASIMSFWIIRNPTQTIYVYFFPVPAWAFGLLFMGYSFYAMDSNSSVGHAAHFGGGIFGLALHYAIKKRFFRK
jgi:membrane associated rhomboid family serine protease